MGSVETKTWAAGLTGEGLELECPSAHAKAQRCLETLEQGCTARTVPGAAQLSCRCP